MITRHEIKHAHIFCGLGGGARGFNQGHARIGNVHAKFRCLGGIDVDRAAIRDFERLSGVPGTLLDLFDYEQYTAFFGKEPPADWRPATPRDIHAAFGYERPDVVFTSPPCKGFSGLLSESKSRSGKYQSLNGLTLRGIWLTLEAYKDDPVPLIILENVPRIATRGRHLLDQITALLRSYGYVVAETTHDCGELGGLAQSRKRFLLVARHVERVPSFLYQPAKRPLRAVGDVLSRMPRPGDPAAGPMHRMPRLQWKTWVRLAFVEAGSDWRSLNRLTVENGYLRDFGIIPERGPWRDDVLGVLGWDATSGTITGKSSPTNGRFAVADPTHLSGSYGKYAVTPYDGVSGTVIFGSTTGQGAFAVADPLPDNDLRRTVLGVTQYGEPANTVTSRGFPLNGKFAVADPVHTGADYCQYGVIGWDESMGAVSGQSKPGGGKYAIADPRPDWMGSKHDADAYENIYRVVRYASACKAVTGASHTAGGALSVADPNYPVVHHSNVFRVVSPHDHAGTITGGGHPSAGGQSVADPRGGCDRNLEDPFYNAGSYDVRRYDEPCGAVKGAASHDNGYFSVADPLPEIWRDGRQNFAQGHYGVTPWCSPNRTVGASACYDNGYFSVADFRLPDPVDNLVCCIIASDNTWHRPFTTLELAALQGLIDPEEHLELEGLSDSAWRERIGNAVPPPAARAIADVMGEVLLLTRLGETFSMHSSPIWVRPIAAALMSAQGEFE